MKRLNVKLPDEYFAELQMEAQAIGLSVKSYLLHCVANWRAKALKSTTSGRPPGRPKMSADEKKFREISAEISDTYKRLREGIWAANLADFERIFGPQIAEVGELVKTKNLAGLEAFYALRPWVLP